MAPPVSPEKDQSIPPQGFENTPSFYGAFGTSGRGPLMKQADKALVWKIGVPLARGLWIQVAMGQKEYP